MYGTINPHTWCSYYRVDRPLGWRDMLSFDDWCDSHPDGDLHERGHQLLWMALSARLLDESFEVRVAAWASLGVHDGAHGSECVALVVLVAAMPDGAYEVLSTMPLLHLQAGLPLLGSL